jgi:hypothetical protein
MCGGVVNVCPRINFFIWAKFADFGRVMLIVPMENGDNLHDCRLCAMPMPIVYHGGTQSAEI